MSDQESYEQLKNREQNLREIASIMLLESRSLLQPILGITEIILDDARSQGKDSAAVTVQKEELLVLERNAGRLYRLIVQLLDVLKIEYCWLRLVKEQLNIQDAIRAVTDDMNACNNYRSKVSIEFQLDDAIVLADRDRISQVLYELLDNAMKFAQKASIVITSEKRENEVEVMISDNGSGIEAEVLPKLFTKFVTNTKPTFHPGLGLGLYISKSLIEAHGGKIWGENNRDGNGAKFAFTLPMTG